MKKPVIIWVSALVLLTSATLLFAQTTTGSSLITEMKASVHAFTLAGDLNPGVTGLESSPLVGKKTGDMLSAGEYNRLLELVSQGGGSNTLLNSPVTVDELTLLPTWKQVRSIDLSTKISIPSGSTHAILNIHCGVCSGNPGSCNSPNNPESITVTRMDGKTMCRAYSGLLKSGSASIDSYNGDMDTNTTYIALESDGKTIKYNVEQNNNGDGEQGHVEILGFVTNGTGGGGGGGWVDVPLTDTADFDMSCIYRMTATGTDIAGGSNMRYAVGVQAGQLFFGFNLNPGWIGWYIAKGTKATFSTNSNGSFAVNKIEKLCAGSGGGDSAPSGTLCGSLFTQRDDVGGATCTNTQNTVKCAGQALSMPAACGNTNPCAAMTGCPAGYDPVAVGYSWGWGQTVQTPVYMYNQCSCAKQ